MLSTTGSSSQTYSREPATSGAMIPVRRPSALATAPAVPRTRVGNTSGVYP